MTPFDLQNADFGGVVLVAYPFTNLVGSKRRPAVVVSKRSYNAMRPDVVIMPVTTRLHTPTGISNVPIENWQAANLLRPSAVKPVFSTLVQGLVLGSLGHLDQADRTTLHDAIRSFLGLTT